MSVRVVISGTVRRLFGTQVIFSSRLSFAHHGQQMFLLEGDMAAHADEIAAQHVADGFGVQRGIGGAKAEQGVDELLDKALVFEMFELQPFQRGCKFRMAGDGLLDPGEEDVFLKPVRAHGQRADRLGGIDAFLAVDLCGQAVGNLFQFAAEFELFAMDCLQPVDGADTLRRAIALLEFLRSCVSSVFIFSPV